MTMAMPSDLLHHKHNHGSCAHADLFEAKPMGSILWHHPHVALKLGMNIGVPMCMNVWSFTCESSFHDLVKAWCNLSAPLHPLFCHIHCSYWSCEIQQQLDTCFHTEINRVHSSRIHWLSLPFLDWHALLSGSTHSGPTFNFQIVIFLRRWFRH